MEVSSGNEDKTVPRGTPPRQRWVVEVHSFLLFLLEERLLQSLVNGALCGSLKVECYSCCHAGWSLYVENVTTCHGAKQSLPC